MKKWLIIVLSILYLLLLAYSLYYGNTIKDYENVGWEKMKPPYYNIYRIIMIPSSYILIVLFCTFLSNLPKTDDKL